MGVILNTNYRVRQDGGDRVGWPVPSPDQPLWAYERIARNAAAYRRAGFTAVLLPPFTKGAAGAASGGYDKFDDFDIGGKDQCFSVPTAFGTAEMLRQCVASIHAHQMQAYGDMVLHQYGGGTAAGVYAPAGSRARPLPQARRLLRRRAAASRPIRCPTRAATSRSATWPLKSNGEPGGYMRDGAIAAAGWLTRTTGVDGWRIDDVKGTNAALVHDLLQSDALRELWAFGEYGHVADHPRPGHGRWPEARPADPGDDGQRRVLLRRDEPGAAVAWCCCGSSASASRSPARARWTCT